MMKWVWKEKKSY
jgi:coaBC_dfp: phosphopantothenoylcysteine decarboxylase/phosphopantothenate--cysteine ligase